MSARPPVRSYEMQFVWICLGLTALMFPLIQLGWGDAQVYYRGVHGPSQLKVAYPGAARKSCSPTHLLTHQHGRPCPRYSGNKKEVDVDVLLTQKG